MMTFHGGCPVLAGSKWITNKWIRQFSQVWNFPCSLKSDQIYRLNPVSNDVCEMTDSCDNMDLFRPSLTYKEAMIATTRTGEEMDGLIV